MKSKIKYFSKGSIIADSHEQSTGLMVITSGKVGIELPMDSEEVNDENNKADGKTLLYVLERG
jgi:signal-transduction protein with cAMP-binding, CBS, and nucleotidyltransferase domain